MHAASSSIIKHFLEQVSSLQVTILVILCVTYTIMRISNIYQLLIMLKRVIMKKHVPGSASTPNLPPVATISPTASPGLPPPAMGSSSNSPLASPVSSPLKQPSVFAKSPFPNPQDLVAAYNSAPASTKRYYEALDLILTEYGSQVAPSSGTLAAIVCFAECHDRAIWHRTLEITCTHLANKKLSSTNICLALTKMLRAVVKHSPGRLTSDDMQAFLVILMPEVDGLAAWMNRSSESAITILNLLIFIANTMLDLKFIGVAENDTILTPLTNIIQQDTEAKAIVRHKAWYAKNLLLGLRSEQQIWNDKVAHYRNLFDGATHLFKIGVAIAGAVACPITLLLTTPDMINDLSEVYKLLKLKGYREEHYNEYVRNSVEFLTLTSIALYTNNKDYAERYLCIVQTFIKQKYNYHGDNIVIIKDIIDIIIACLLNIKVTPMFPLIAKLFDVLVTIYHFCNLHFYKLAPRSNDGSYNEIRSYLFYSVHRLRAMGTFEEVRALAAFFLVSKMEGNDKHDKAIELLAVRVVSGDEATEYHMPPCWRNLTRPVRRSSIDLS